MQPINREPAPLKDKASDPLPCGAEDGDASEMKFCCAQIDWPLHLAFMKALDEATRYRLDLHRSSPGQTQ